MNDEDILNELKKINAKLDRIRKLNDDIRFILMLMIIVSIYLGFFLSFPYFLGH